MKTIVPNDIQPDIHIANHLSQETGSVWGWRTIPDLEAILFLEGTFEFEQEAHETLVLEANDVLIVFPDIPHRLRHTGGGAELSSIHCELLEDLSYAAFDYRLEPALRQVTRIWQDDPIKDGFLRCADLFSRHGTHRQALLQTCAREVWLRLCEYWSGTSVPEYYSERMSAMLTFLRQRLTEPVGRNELASHFHLAPEYINALFKKELGMSPTEFILRERMRRAFLMLQEQDISVQEAGDAVGFPDPFHFSRTFKRIYNLPPSHIRRFMKRQTK